MPGDKMTIRVRISGQTLQIDLTLALTDCRLAFPRLCNKSKPSSDLSPSNPCTSTTVKQQPLTARLSPSWMCLRCDGMDQMDALPRFST